MTNMILHDFWVGLLLEGFTFWHDSLDDKGTEVRVDYPIYPGYSGILKMNDLW